MTQGAGQAPALLFALVIPALAVRGQIELP